jgi:hypothetical protein
VNGLLALPREWLASAGEIGSDRVHLRRRVRVSVKHTTHGSLTMPIEMTAQNGMVLHQNTPIAITNCPKAKKTSKHGKSTRHTKK